MSNKKRREVSDALASNLINEEPQNKVAKIDKSPLKATAAVYVPEHKVQEAPQLEIKYPTDTPSSNNFPLFPDFDDIPDDLLINTLTQIEKENVQIMPNQMNVTKESATTSINFNRPPQMPHMYFPNSNVTINYHFHKHN